MSSITTIKSITIYLYLDFTVHDDIFSDTHMIYTLFKKLATEICLTTFLHVDFEESADIAEQIVSLTTTHWHGIVILFVIISILTFLESFA